MEKDTVWRITIGDIEDVVRDKFPKATEEQVDQLVDMIIGKFEIPNWAEIVGDFVELYADDVVSTGSTMYDCFFCEEVSSGDEWNRATSKAYGGDDINPIEDIHASMCGYVCPKCGRDCVYGEEVKPYKGEA